MILPAILAVAATAPDRDLVFAARYYYQDKRKSYHQIYLCHHNGTNRIQLTNNEFDSSAPMWIDRTHIAYVEQYKPVPSTRTTLSQCRVILLDLKKGTRKKLAELGPLEVFWGLWSRGNSFEGEKTDADNSAITIRYQVSLTGVTPLPPITVVPYTEDLQDDSRGFFSWDHQVGKWFLHWTKTDPNMGGDTDADVANCSINLKSGFKGKTKNFKLHGNRLMQVMVAKDGTGIIVTSFAYEKYRADHFIYKFTNSYQTCESVSHKIGNVHVNAKSPLWLAGQPGQREGAMERLKDGRGVYVHWLYSGNWQTGVQWTVATGAVYVGSSQLRPEVKSK